MLGKGIHALLSGLVVAGLAAAPGAASDLLAPVSATAP